ncbi:SRPBCC family protein [Nocardioides bigeumensis]|uniref:SRPBCC family protein n=1 Tax=Nocardioides bigeumensis TaxID=433657 RepID=A0ABN2XMF2_9ACTN
MQLKHRFAVPAKIDETWAALNDLERVALCFPGASMDSVEGDTFAGTVRLKVGPIVMRYVGSGAFASRDAENYRASVVAKGRDRSGNGTANVNVAMSLAPQPDGTEVEVVTDLAISGRAAQFGSSVITEVSDRLLLEFVDRLSEQLGGHSGSNAGSGGVAGADATQGPEPGTGSAGRAQSVETLDFGKLLGPALAKRFAPPAAVVLLLIGVFLWTRRRPAA